MLAAGCSLPHAELRGDSSAPPDIITDRPDPMDVVDVLDVIDDVPSTRDAMDVADVVEEDATVADVRDVQDVADTGVCPMGTMSCSGTCVDTSTSIMNCGMCGRSCGDGLVCRTGNCVPALDCEELRAVRGITSSTQTLDTDNDPDSPAVSVWCDVSDGRGWTVVFGGRTADMARTFDFNSSAEAAAQWSAPGPLAMRSTLVKFAYRDAASAVVDAANAATFSIPASWRAGTNPFSQAADETMVSVSIGGGASTMRLLKFGYNSMFVRECGEGWFARSFGRVCIVGTTAPYFVAWASTDVDQCRNSDYTASGTGTMAATPPCSTDRRFTIALSR